MHHLLLTFTYLQVLDFLTTIACLVNGIPEGNPFVRAAMSWAPHPLTGLAFVKVLALCLGLYCWRMERRKVLSRINLWFAVLVAWNLIALIWGSLAGHN